MFWLFHWRNFLSRWTFSRQPVLERIICHNRKALYHWVFSVIWDTKRNCHVTKHSDPCHWPASALFPNLCNNSVYFYLVETSETVVVLSSWENPSTCKSLQEGFLFFPRLRGWQPYFSLLVQEGNGTLNPYEKAGMTSSYERQVNYYFNTQIFLC